MESEVIVKCLSSTPNPNEEIPTSSKNHSHHAGKNISFDDNIKSEDENSSELLGSVTMKNCPGVRISARVIQKMKENSCRALTPPPNERELKIKEEKALQKTPSQAKPTKVIWTNLERNFFFDAVNEYGKDFEGIANYINAKLKRKSITDQCFKTKEQIRTIYYQTFHKLSKYIKFSDDVKKPIPELYALINYGEMRRKLQFVSEKNCMKIRDLVYKGYVTVRSKGKNIRIKTPSCKALRKLNQLEDWLDDIKLPPKVEVCLRPATMESWARVQSIAQNPVIKTSVPLQKKLVNVIKTFQHKWRSRETNLILEASKIAHSNISNNDPTKTLNNNNVEVANMSQEPILCFRPLPDVNIHRPLVSITEFLSSFNICLNSYEERIGVKIRGETLCHDRFPHKRARTDSGCEKKSPDGKKIKPEPNENVSNPKISTTQIVLDPHPSDVSEMKKIELMNETKNANITGSNETNNKTPPQEIDLPDEFLGILCDIDDNNINVKQDKPDSNIDVDNRKNNNNNNETTEKKKESGTICNKTTTSNHKYKKKYLTKSSRKKDTKKEINNLRPLVNEDVIRTIRKGWSILNAADITIGDLYIVLGQDSKLIFEYFWNEQSREEDIGKTVVEDDQIIYTTGMVTYNGFISVNNEEIPEHPTKAINKIKECSLGNKLKQLLLIANLADRMKRKSCSCGHLCDKVGKTRMDYELINRNFNVGKQYSATNSDNNLFRQPTTPFRKPAISMESLKQIANNLHLKRSRFFRGGSTTLGSRHVLVQRMLPVQPGLNQSYDFVEMKNLQNNLSETNRQKLLKQQQTNQILEEQMKIVNDNNHNNEKQSKATQVEIQLEDVATEIPSILINKNINTDINHTKEDCYKNFNNNNNNNNSCTTDKCDEDPGLAALLELSLPSPLPATNKFTDNNTNDTSYMNTPSMSPFNNLRDNSDSRWIEENFNDFSLSSLLGHLDEINNGRDITIMDSNISVISETSVDYMSKFAEIAASMQNNDD